MLEVKVENASTISIKEKYRQDMKREIKRLQRLRDIFRQNVNNPAIVEQHRLVEARKRIETVSLSIILATICAMRDDICSFYKWPALSRVIGDGKV